MLGSTQLDQITCHTYNIDTNFVAIVFMYKDWFGADKSIPEMLAPTSMPAWDKTNNK